MTEPRAEFKRMLLRLPQSATDYPAVAVTAQLADVLGLSLVATFIQDANLLDLAALPCVRELQPLGGGWHPIDVMQLERQLEHAGTLARRLFHQSVRTSGVEASFNVAKGPFVEMMGSSASADDIIVIIEPQNPAERVTQQFIRLIDAAFGACAAVMVVPSRIARTAGPIAAVISGPDDPSIRSAFAIAAAAKERVIVLGPPGLNACASLADLAEIAKVRVEAGPTIRDPLDVSSLLTHLAHLNERLVVMSRAAAIDRAVPTIASLRRIPVLFSGPPTPLGSTVKPAKP
jgi:hypothetical protein